MRWTGFCPFTGSWSGPVSSRVLRSFTKDLAVYRNGFDHAWTAKAGALPDIDRKGEAFFGKLKTVLTTARRGADLGDRRP